MTRLLPDYSQASKNPLPIPDTIITREDAPTVEKLLGDKQPSNVQSGTPAPLSAPALGQFASSSLPDLNFIGGSSGDMEPPLLSGHGRDSPEKQSTAGSDPGSDPLDDLLSRLKGLRSTLDEFESVLVKAASVDIDPSAFVSSLSEVIADQFDKSTSLLAAHRANIFPYVNEQIYHTRRAEAKLLEALIPAGQTLKDFLAKDSIDDSVFEQQILPLQSLFEEI